jgi:hypothetical protein
MVSFVYPGCLAFEEEEIIVKRSRKMQKYVKVLFDK